MQDVGEDGDGDEEESIRGFADVRNRRPMVPKHLRAPEHLLRRASNENLAAEDDVRAMHSGSGSKTVQAPLHDGVHDTNVISYDASFARSLPVAQVCL